MSAGAWREVDPGDLAPVVLVAGGFLTTPGWYRPLAASLRERGAAAVVVAPVYPPDWVLCAVRGLGPVTTRVGRALLGAGEASRAQPSSRGAPILYVGHSAGGIVGRLLDLARAVRGPPAQRRWQDRRARHPGHPHPSVTRHAGSRVADAGARYANRHVPGAFFAPRPGHLAVASRSIVGNDDGEDGRSRFMRRLYEDVHPSPDQPMVAGDGLVPVASALLPGARHLVLEDAVPRSRRARPVVRAGAAAGRLVAGRAGDMAAALRARVERRPG